jgi:SanA protein
MKYLINATAIFSGTMVWALLSAFLIEHSTQNYLYDNMELIPERECALVLGANKNGKNGINEYFHYRMEAASALYFNKKVKKIIVSGDNHRKGYDETTDMAEYLITLGVPDSAIIRDYAGFRTLDSVVRSKKVFNCKSLIIVSQKFHNQRAVFIAHQYKIDAIAFNAQDVSSKTNLTHIREIGAKFLAILDLFVFNRQPKFL